MFAQVNFSTAHAPKKNRGGVTRDVVTQSVLWDLLWDFFYAYLLRKNICIFTQFFFFLFFKRKYQRYLEKARKLILKKIMGGNVVYSNIFTGEKMIIFLRHERDGDWRTGGVTKGEQVANLIIMNNKWVCYKSNNDALIYRDFACLRLVLRRKFKNQFTTDCALSETLYDIFN